MEKEAADRRRVEIRDYMECKGLNIRELALILSPDKDKEASLGKFLRSKQHDLRGGMMQRFKDLQNGLTAVSETAEPYADGEKDPWGSVADELQALVDFVKDEAVSPGRKLERFQKTIGRYFRLLVAFSASTTNGAE